MPSKANQEAVRQIADLLDEKGNFVLSGYRGIGVNELNGLRNEMRGNGIIFKVVKNKLLRLVLEERGFDPQIIGGHLRGASIVAFCESDISVAARKLKEYGRAKKKEGHETSPIDMKMGVADGVIYDKEAVEKIADLPAREVLLAQVMSLVNSPATGIAGVMSSVISTLARTIEAVAEKQNGSS